MKRNDSSRETQDIYELRKSNDFLYITLESTANCQKFLLEGLCARFCISASSFSLIRHLVGSMTAAFIACKWHTEKHGTDSLLVES